MKTFIGVKAVQAEPQDRPLGSAEDPLGQRNGEPGYKVVYPDGYESWSPKEVFEEAYVEVPDSESDRILGATKRHLGFLADETEHLGDDGDEIGGQ